jgi:hypothetical protein
MFQNTLKIPQDASEYFKILQKITRIFQNFPRELQDTSEFFRISQNTSQSPQKIQFPDSSLKYKTCFAIKIKKNA